MAMERYDAVVTILMGGEARSFKLVGVSWQQFANWMRGTLSDREITSVGITLNTVEQTK